jgi:hypothetical protein
MLSDPKRRNGAHPRR